MADDFQRLWDTVARDPGDPAFVQLGEQLRRRGELESAARVAVAGLERQPDLADGHDLYARVLTDMGDYDAAEEEWREALAVDPRHAGANKGLGFLSFQRGDLEAALDCLEIALAANPSDQTTVRALQTVRAAAESAGDGGALAAKPVSSPVVSRDMIFAGLEGAEDGILLVDQRGRVLGGRLETSRDGDLSESVAAYLAGATQEAERTARMLDLGEWRWIVVEGQSGNAYVTPPTDDSLLFIVRDRSVPAGRLTMVAERAGAAARQWLTRQRL